MALALPRLSPLKVIDLEEFPLEKPDREWLQKKLPKKPTIDDINQLANRLAKAAPDDPEERRRLSVLIGVQASLKGNFVARGKDAISSGGKTKLFDLHVLALTGARPVNGESDKVRSVRERMENFLIGQQHARQTFADFAAATQAPGRRIPPVMVIAGPDGHGKAQAVEGFAEVLSEGSVHHVDLFGKTDRDYGGIFEAPGAPLALDTLKAIADTKGTVWVTGCEDINAPKIAQGLARRINALRGTAGHVKLPYVLDYTVDAKRVEHDDSRDLIKGILAKTLDTQGLRAKANHAIFKPLTPEAMLLYADALLAQILKTEGLEGVSVTFDPDARELLGKLLATPFAPLNELEARLRELILRKIDTQTSVYRRGGFIRITLGKPFQDNADLRDNLVSKFSEKHVDLELGSVAFEPLETGRIVDKEGLAEALVESARTYSHLLKRLAVHIEKSDAVPAVLEMERSTKALGALFSKLPKFINAETAARIEEKKSPLSEELVKTVEQASREFGTAVSRLLVDPLFISRGFVDEAVALREQLYEVLDLLSEGSSLEAMHAPMAAQLAGTFGQALLDLGAKIEGANPSRAQANLLAGLESLSKVVDMSGLAAKNNAQRQQIDIIRRDDAKVIKQALEEVRQILLGFSMESGLGFRALMNGVRVAGYEEKAPLSMRLVDIARDIVDSMQGEEDVMARERCDLAISALRDFLSDAAAEERSSEVVS